MDIKELMEVKNVPGVSTCLALLTCKVKYPGKTCATKVYKICHDCAADVKSLIPEEKIP